MSILIKGMEMPNKKNGAVLIIYPDGKCAFEYGKTYQAVSVPPHGRLIDGDKLNDYLKTAAMMADGEAKEAYIDARAEARTMAVIIPAEEGKT